MRTESFYYYEYKRSLHNFSKCIKPYLEQIQNNQLVSVKNEILQLSSVCVNQRNKLAENKKNLDSLKI